MADAQMTRLLLCLSQTIRLWPDQEKVETYSYLEFVVNPEETLDVYVGHVTYVKFQVPIVDIYDADS